MVLRLAAPGRYPIKVFWTSDGAGTTAAALTSLSGEPVPPWPYAVTIMGGRSLG